MAPPALDPKRFLRKTPPRKFRWWHVGIAWVFLDLGLLGLFRPRIAALSARYRADIHAGSNAGTATVPDEGTESIRAEAAAQQDAINGNRALADSLLARVKSSQDEYESLEGRRAALQAELASLKQRYESGAAIDVEEFNAKVRTINELNPSVQSAYARYQDGFREYERAIQRDSQLVERFNARFTGGK